MSVEKKSPEQRQKKKTYLEIIFKSSINAEEIDLSGWYISI
jgi:hypothetical protein